MGRDSLLCVGPWVQDLESSVGEGSLQAAEREARERQGLGLCAQLRAEGFRV